MSDEVLAKFGLEFELALDQEEGELRAAVDQAFAVARKAPTRANTSAFTKAKADLEKFLKAREESRSDSEILANIPAVIEYLEDKGYRLGKTKAYDDRQAGFLKSQEDGTFRSEDVETYAREHLKLADGTRSSERGSLQEQKLRGEADRVRHDAELKRLRVQREQGEVIEREQVEIELSSRAAFLRSDLKNVGRAGVMEIIKMVGGDPQKAPKFVAWWVLAVDEILDRYARPIRIENDGE